MIVAETDEGGRYFYSEKDRIYLAVSAEYDSIRLLIGSKGLHVHFTCESDEALDIAELMMAYAERRAGSKYQMVNVRDEDGNSHGAVHFSRYSNRLTMYIGCEYVDANFELTDEEATALAGVLRWAVERMEKKDATEGIDQG